MGEFFTFLLVILNDFHVYFTAKSIRSENLEELFETDLIRVWIMPVLKSLNDFPDKLNVGC